MKRVKKKETNQHINDVATKTFSLEKKQDLEDSRFLLLTSFID